MTISLISKNEVDIMVLTETWLDDSIKDCELCPPWYNILRRDRNCKGGGVAFLISSKVPFKHSSNF